jgi:hypothetical protein
VPDEAGLPRLDDEGTEAALAAAAGRLRAEFSDIDHAEIDRVLRASYEQVAADASVGSFLPLFAERRARKALHDAGSPDDAA